MTLIRPFQGLRPRQEKATEVVAPPYDVLSTEEARVRAEGRPYSFLHISKPEIDLPEDTNPFDAAVYQKGADNLNKLITDGILIQDDKPCYYAYRLIMGDQEQTGLVVVANVADYDTNRIRKHEFTRPEKEDDRTRQIDALNAQTGPVFLTYRQNADVDKVLESVTQGKPEYDLKADDNVQHTIWVIDDATQVASLTQYFDDMDCLYIADGHHRSAAASRIAAQHKQENNQHTGDEPYNYFLSVIFPDNQMNILDYNRVIKDLNNLSSDEIIKQVASSFDISESDSPVKPTHAGQFGMYMQGRWYQLDIHTDKVPADDPVARLDVSLLANNLIDPVLNIQDPRRDKRIDFVGGIRGLQELEKRVDSGEMAIAFSLFPTSLSDLMAVADANEVMPPKSTWFEPKLADGLVSHKL
ncbi:MAG: DUF1015 domain-containing protein [Gammaproteobacteria bacterium]|nr:DUF1015 domain-containing protein [Gammaproteobacteria bacterium]